MTKTLLRKCITCVLGLFTVFSALFSVFAYLDTTGFFDNEYIAIMMTGQRIDFSVPKEFEDGFGTEEWLTSKGNEKNAKKYKIKKAKPLDESEAAKQIIKFADDKNCLLVITNSTSSLTKRSINTLIEKKASLPVIIPIATDEEILEGIVDSKYKGVLRLVPGNKIQAKTISDFLFSLKQKPNCITAQGVKVGIFIDEENTAYSDNLTRLLVKNIRKKGGKIVFRNRIGNSHGIRPPLDIIKSADFFVYIGISHNAVGLTNELSEIEGLSTPLIMSEGCLTKEISKETKSYAGKRYVLSPIDIEAVNKDIIPSYKTIGRRARVICEIVLSGNPTRQSLLEKIEFYKESKSEKYSECMAELNIPFSFEYDGSISVKDYFIYSITEDRLEKKEFPEE